MVDSQILATRTTRRTPRPLTIAHVAQIEISRSGGMARVAWHWRAELERRGHKFVHVGRRPLGHDVHPALYPFAAWAAVRRIAPAADLVLAHEPAAAPFAVSRVPLVVFSHGLERRGWTVARDSARLSGENIRLRSRLLYPLWRVLSCEFGLRRAAGAMVLNRADHELCLSRYGRSRESTLLFRNGAESTNGAEGERSGEPPVVLFLGSWIARKGIRTLAQAAGILLERGTSPHWLLAGTGASAEQVLRSWPGALRDRVEVVPSFPPEAEPGLMRRADALVLPSFFEGQPLSLLQAMAAGVPVVVSDIAGHNDLVTHEKTGLLFEPGDAPALAAQLARACGDRELRRRLGMAAALSMRGREWPAVAAEVADFIERTHGRVLAAAAPA